MVWGIRMPSDFNRFFPDGKYVDKDEWLKEHYHHVLSDEDRARFDNRLVTYRYTVSKKFTEDLGPLEIHEQLARFRTLVPYKALGSIINTNNRLLAVDQKLRDLIEDFEPGVHQFWPITIEVPNMFLRKYLHHSKPYWGLIIRRFLDGFSADRTDCDAFLPPPSKGPIAKIPFEGDSLDIAMSKTAIGDAHLWRERTLKGFDFYLSDRLYEEMKRQRLTAPKAYKLLDV